MSFESKYEGTAVREITKNDFEHTQGRLRLSAADLRLTRGDLRLSAADLRLTGGKIKKKQNNEKNKPAFIVVYAPWCPHCVGIVDDMDSLAKGFKDYGVDVMAVNSDNPANTELVEELGVNGFPSFLWSDENGELTQITDMESRDVHGFVKMVCVKSGDKENCCSVDSNSKTVKCSKKGGNKGGKRT